VHARFRRSVGAVVVLALSLLLAAPGTAGAATKPTVLLIHGFEGTPASFATMAARLRAAGRVVDALALPGQDNVANARAIQDYVAGHHLASVDIVAHSMGGLSARWYVEELGGARTVAHYVSLGSPQQGLQVACLLPLEMGGQMCPTSAFMSRLNGAATPRSTTTYTSIFSQDDGFVPVASSVLGHPACLVDDAGVSHGGLLTDARVYRQVLAALGGHCPGSVAP